MSEITGGTSAEVGVDLVMPGSTYGGLLEEPQSGWALLFGDESTATFTVDGSLDELEKLLEAGLAKVRRRKALLDRGSLIEVQVDGYTYLVPAALYDDGMPREQVVDIAVSVEEPEDEGRYFEFRS